MLTLTALATLSCCLTAAPQPGDGAGIQTNELGIPMIGGTSFGSWQEYNDSPLFQALGLRCGTDAVPIEGDADEFGVRGGSTADCSSGSTNPSALYDPSVVHYRIPVVFHVLRRSNGTTGNVPMSQINNQIDILNEDFLAILGTPGEPGTDCQVEFFLATEDPSGNPTTGVTYSNNDTWYNDGGSYYNTLAWDTNRYLNIYTNTASGNLGYVPSLPQGGIVGSSSDRVVVLWSTVGRNAPYGPPYNQGRTVTHEVGHYLGLYHVFQTCDGGNCNTSGDRICDTPPSNTPNFGCSQRRTCSADDAFHNYMDYTDDTCMNQFTPVQARRMRCTLEHWRPNLWDIATSGCDADFDGDGDADGIDVGLFLNAYGTGSAIADMDGDGDTDGIDVGLFLQAYGLGC